MHGSSLVAVALVAALSATASVVGAGAQGAPEFIGRWAEDPADCATSGAGLSPGVLVFEPKVRRHFEGSCTVRRAARIGAKWELDEECRGSHDGPGGAVRGRCEPDGLSRWRATG